MLTVKHILILFLLLFLVGQNQLYAQLEPVTWEWLNPMPIGSPLLGIDVGTNGRIIAVGRNGTIFVSDDFGVSGMEYNIGSSLRWNDVETLPDGSGLIIGVEGRILRTEDGGDSWRLVRSRQYDTLRSVSMIDSLTAVVVGNTYYDKGLVFRTTDGGKSWSELLMPRNNATFHDVQLLDSGIGWIAGARGALFRTSDSGASWTDVSRNLSTDLLSIDFSTKNLGVIVGTESTILQTEDAGLHWSQKVPATLRDYYSVKWIDSSSVVALEFGGVRLSIDSGRTWVSDPKEIHQLYSVDCGSDGKVIAVGEHGKIAERNPVNGWTLHHTPDMTFHIADVEFINNQKGLVVGNRGNTATTTDGGKNWTVRSIGVTQGISDVEYDSSGIVIAVGNNATIARSTDHGMNWDIVHDGGPSYYAVAMVDQRHAVVVGRGTIGTTHDSGVSWKIDTTTGWGHLRFCTALDSATMFVLGVTGQIYRTNNGGLSWDSVMTGAIEGYYGPVKFISRDTGLFTSKSDFFGTTDGGNVWERWAGPKAERVVQLNFTNRLKGWMVTTDNAVADPSNNPRIWRTSNGGRKWDSVPYYVVETTNYGDGGFGTIEFLDDTTGWIVGGNGAVLSYRSNATPISAVPDLAVEGKDSVHPSVYPNPTAERISVRLVGGDRIVSMRLSDAIGRVIPLPPLYGGFVLPSASVSFSVEGLEAGSYYLFVDREDGASHVMPVIVK